MEEKKDLRLRRVNWRNHSVVKQVASKFKSQLTKLKSDLLIQSKIGEDVLKFSENILFLLFADSRNILSVFPGVVAEVIRVYDHILRWERCTFAIVVSPKSNAYKPRSLAATRDGT